MPSSKFSSRTWGTRFDPLPSPPPASPKSSVATESNVDHVSAAPQTLAKPFFKRGDKMPHDASVFVGSLPVDVEHNELGHLLSEHLSEYAEIKSVKVIRDAKGGVCAFVQCEDADAAAKLIQTLHSAPPKPFLKRILRYEPARAHRSLLISYRTPTDRIMPTDHSSSAEKVLELPSAMRISKLRNAKPTAITYNENAIHIQTQATVNPAIQGSDIVLFREPLKFDAATLKDICAHFGPLEHFKSYAVEETDGEDKGRPISFPSPHDAPRTEEMDDGCFEVKWAHRDDCITALMNLRWVPHLTVTWAHPASENRDQGRHNFPYPFHPRVRGSSVSTSGRSTTPSVNTATVVQPKDWTILPQPPLLQHDPSSSSTLVDPNSSKGPEWLETEFPLLNDRKTKLKSGFDVGGVCVEEKKKQPPAEDENEKFGGNFVDETSSGVHSLTPAPGGAPFEVLNDVTPFTSSIGRHHVATITEDFPDSGSQELEMNHTPALARSPVTPKTPGSGFPPTPTGYHHCERPTLFSKDVNEEQHFRTEGFPVDEQVLDPTQLFVGGLEMHGPGAWDEEKVTNYFRSYGGLESVSFIRPGSGKAAFAFVKFNNVEAPAQAIRQEHNRTFEGRAMRVQLRDCNPATRVNLRGGRGRGRYTSYGGGHQHRQSFHFSDSSKKDKSVDASFRSEDPSATNVSALDSSETDASFPSSTGTSPGETEHTTAEPSMSAPASPVQPNANGTEHYREWYEMENQAPPGPEAPGAAFTPFEGGPGMLCAPPPGAQFYPPPWVPPYAPPHMQYPMYCGYPAPMVPVPNGPPARFPGSSGAEPNGPAPMPHALWNAYIPYNGYAVRPANAEQGQGQEQAPVPQAPVTPYGFVQGPEGLMVVWPQATLEQYLANNPDKRGSPPMGVPVTIPSTVPSPIPPLLTPSNGPMQAWPQGPPPYGPNQLAARMGPPLISQGPAQLGPASGNWIAPNHPMGFQGPRGPGLPPLVGMAMPGPLPFREGLHDGVQSHGPHGNKRQGRREQFHGKGRGSHRGRGGHNGSYGDGYMNRGGQVNGNGNVQAVGEWIRWQHPDAGKPFIS